MINSGPDPETNETGGWTDFNQADDCCQGGTNAPDVSDKICGEKNEKEIVPGNMATNGGEIQSAFNKLIGCWNEITGKINSWNVTVPVVTCPSNNLGTCEKVVGAVNIDIVWITAGGEDPGYNDAPTEMDDWSSDDDDGQVRWNSFVEHFNLLNADGNPAEYMKKCIYFKPDCSYHEPTGHSGNRNFGVMAKIPRLVK